MEKIKSKFFNFKKRLIGNDVSNPHGFKHLFLKAWLFGKKPLLIISLIGIGFLILIPLLTYLFFIRDLTSKESILAKKSEGVILLDRNEKPFFTFYQPRQQKIIPLSEIPKNLQDAVIAIEDKNFYKHNGFSLEGIGRAFLVNIKKDEIAQGGSTITQQLVKNTLLSPDKNLLRKYQELVLALEIERRYQKNEILEMYLNTVYFGEGAYGVENAAEAYFSKKAKDLTLPESAMLAGILPAPSAYSPLSGNRDMAIRRQHLVLEQMQKQNYINKDEYQTALEKKLTYNPTVQEINQNAPHFALMVIDELNKEYGEQRVARSGFKVKTTLDLAKQQFAEKVVKNQVNNLSRNNVTNGASVAIDPHNGEILALVGSHNWFDDKNGKINMVLQPRQPGSSFKPIVYAKGIEDKVITAATVLKDEKITFPGGYTPKNYDNRFRGDVLVRYALANSLNIPAIEVLEKVGVSNAIELAEEMGITTLKEPSRYGLSLVLGSAEVSLLQMTSAFGVMANKGVYVQPVLILEIQDKNGKNIYQKHLNDRRVLGEDTAFIISSILSDNSARADTFGNSLTITRPAAVKTGTTDDYRDALTIGYTPNLVVGAWVGNNDREPMDSIAGSLGAAPIWRQIVNQFSLGTAFAQFNPPFSIVKQTICKEKGLKVEDDIATSSAYLEFFLPGTVPDEFCNLPTPTPSITETPTPTPTAIQAATPTPTPVPTIAPTISPIPTTSSYPSPTFTLPTLLPTNG